MQVGWWKTCFAQYQNCVSCGITRNKVLICSFNMQYSRSPVLRENNININEFTLSSVTKRLIDCSRKHAIYLSALWTELSANLNCQVCPWSAHCLHGKRHHWGSDESIASCRRVGPTMDPHAHWNKHTHENIHNIKPPAPLSIQQLIWK